MWLSPHTRCWVGGDAALSPARGTDVFSLLCLAGAAGEGGSSSEPAEPRCTRLPGPLAEALPGAGKGLQRPASPAALRGKDSGALPGNRDGEIELSHPFCGPFSCCSLKSDCKVKKQQNTPESPSQMYKKPEISLASLCNNWRGARADVYRSCSASLLPPF